MYESKQEVVKVISLVNMAENVPSVFSILKYLPEMHQGL